MTDLEYAIDMQAAEFGRLNEAKDQDEYQDSSQRLRILEAAILYLEMRENK